MTLFVHILLFALAILISNVRESEAGCGCCCHCCKCCSCCTPCCNPPLLIKLPRTCPCCCKCCCPCCCCGGGGRKRRDVRLLWKRAVPFPQVHLPGSSVGIGAKCNCGAAECRPAAVAPQNALAGDLFKREKRGAIVNLRGFLFPTLNKEFFKQ